MGKSVLILRYTTNQFAEHTKATIGVNFGHKTIKKDDELIQAQLWDTGTFSPLIHISNFNLNFEDLNIHFSTYYTYLLIYPIYFYLSCLSYIKKET